MTQRSSTPTSGLSGSALITAMVAFIAVYALGLMAIILVSTMFAESALYHGLMLALRIGGWLALALPAWIAARVAACSGWLHGAVIGVAEGALVVVLMTISFSWDGTLRDQVISSMLPAFVAVFVVALLGGGLGEWQNRRLNAR